MSTTGFTTETSARIYDDQYGYWVQIGPDSDSLELAQITYSDGDDKAKPVTFAIPWEMAEKLAPAILKMKELNT